MLTIQPTENLTGLTVSGDYWDLDDLIHAIYEVIGEEKRYFHFEGVRQRLLTVCLKMRQASKGEHGIDYIANGISKDALKRMNAIIPEKNIYYSVNLLTPELIFSALALNDFVSLYKETVDDSEWSIAVTSIRKFQSLVANSIAAFIPEGHYMLFLTTLHTKSPLFHQYATQYVDLLNLEYLSLSKDEREEHMTSFALRFLTEDETYKVLVQQLLDVTSVSKQSLYEVELTLKYPNDESIIW
ncbi:DUF6904 family protein [Solibacillus silvestris]|uniref:DUF6904 family protein n=1 Tax=Solibacillus silvestris TaxID=76853 RepID=UPI003F8120C5